MPLNVTPRQEQLVRLLTEGHSIESAAATLGITHMTAKNYLQTARDRTGMNNFEMVAKLAVQDFQQTLKTA